MHGSHEHRRGRRQWAVGSRRGAVVSAVSVVHHQSRAVDMFVGLLRVTPVQLPRCTRHTERVYFGRRTKIPKRTLAVFATAAAVG